MGTFITRKSIFQRSRKVFSFLNCVTINSFQNCPLITFILIVFLLLGSNPYWSQNLHETFFLFLFAMGFFSNTSFWLQSLLVLLSSDVEINPVPTRTPKTSLSICHWNLNSMSAHNYVKLSLLRPYIVFTNSRLFVLQKHIMTPWKYLDTI